MMETDTKVGSITWSRVFLFATCFLLGIGLGAFTGSIMPSPQHTFGDDNSIIAKRGLVDTFKEHEKIQSTHHKTIANMMKAKSIKQIAKHYTARPHHSGSKRNGLLGREMEKNWKKYGLDKTEVFNYKMMMSYPEKPAEINLMTDGKLEEKLKIKNEPAFGKSERGGHKDVMLPYTAFSVGGDVTGEVVYLNYGVKEDYEEILKITPKVDLKDKIFLMRYGTSHARSTLVNKATSHGAVGVIFYMDPIDFTEPGNEYPKGVDLNKYGIQRGAMAAVKASGEALSIGYPSKPGYYRDPKSSYEPAIKTMTQPISGDTGESILRWMKDGSLPLPSRFRGGMNLTYNLQSGVNRTLTLRVFNKLEDQNTFDVCGTLYGGVDPDQYILMGNHRDSWTFGAADPVSGSAPMTEIARVLGEYHKQTGWRPRRSIMICSWSAEEIGMFGSTEWAFENQKFLQNNVMVYLNVDTGVEGNYTIAIKSLDHMIDSIFEAAQAVDSPNVQKGHDIEKANLYEDMLRNKKMTSDVEEDTPPEYSSPGCCSDFAYMFHHLGISVSDYRFTYNEKDFPKLKGHPGMYHTMYDSYDWMKRFIDPDFKHHLAIGQLWLRHALNMADRTVVPMNVHKYATQVQRLFTKLQHNRREEFTKYNVSQKYAEDSLKKLVKAAKKVQTIVDDEKQMAKMTEKQVRILNNKVGHFEKNFIINTEVGHVKMGHIVYASFADFPGLDGKTWEDGQDIKRELTLFVWCVDMATRSLNMEDIKSLGKDKEE